MRDELGRRPMQTELIARGYNPVTISRGAGSWFEFVLEEGDLNDSQQRVVASLKEWLKTVESTSLNKSYKMVVLRVLLDQSSFFKTVKLSDFAKQCRQYMLEHPVLKRDLVEGKHAVDHQNASDKEWTAWWTKWPIDRWLDEQNGQRWFTLSGDGFGLAIDCPEELRPHLEAMTEELVEGRLARYIQSKRLQDNFVSSLAFTGKVSHAGGRPILFMPDQTQQPRRPVGPTEVQLPDGSLWVFKFVKVACNVAMPAGNDKNQLSDLLRQWFGKDAGLPGTDFRVRFELQNGKWVAAPIGAMPVAEELKESEVLVASDFSAMVQPRVAKSARYTTHVPVFDLVAAAGGFGTESLPEEIGWVEVTGHNVKPGMFAARVVGESMQPRIPSGSLCLFGPCPAGTRQGRLLLVQLNTHSDPEDGGRYTVKRYHSTKRATQNGWEHQAIELQPLNPKYSPIDVDENVAADLRVLGEFLMVLNNPRG
jgi:SOS-response transcriptional repressor LexA